ncbi:MAG: hypothetical protein KAY24_17900, partial [Candidatus Eisenbacteria sp.]|nr:hypothetical protein [Candidatus Eisenbacteria bacterium]
RMRSEEGFHSATKWLRIEIERRGIYVLTAADLIAAGVTDAVDLSALRLFCGPANELPDSAVVEELPEWMEPCALWIEPAQDQTWGEDTRVYFLGNGPDGWCADLGLPETTRDRYYAHPTSKHFTYWLCWDGLFQGEPMRVKEIDAAPGTMELINTARARIHVEKNTKYDSRPREAGVTWERFFYTSIRADSSAGAFVYLDLDGVVPGSSAAYRVSLWGRNWRVDQYVTHTAVIEVNARSLAEVSWMGVGGALATGEIEAETVRNTVAVRVPPRYDYADKALIDQIYLAWVEAEYERALTMERDSLEFFISPDDLAGRGVRISGLAEATGWMLLDASDRRNPVLLQPRYAESEEGYAAEFLLELSDSNAHMVLLKRSKAASPARMTLRKWGEAPWGDAPLRQCTAPIDFLIVTGTKLLEVAESLGEHRRHYFWGGAGDSSMPGRVAVVTIDQVCDEFAWGQHDPNAVRNLASFARSMWKGGGAYPTLSHLLLMGDAYYDPRDYLGTGSQDIVPSHIFYEQRFQTSTLWQPAFIADDWFGLLDGPDDRLLDLAVGRLTVGTPDEAGAVVEKIIAYETDPPLGDWRTRLILAADDICQGYSRDGIGYQHMQDSEKLSNIWAPRDARQGKVYLYEYGSECKYSRKPGATEQLLNAVAHGALLFNFIGHG